MPEDNSQSYSLMSMAGRNGLWLGLYLTVLAYLTAFSVHSPLAGMAVWAGSIYLPFFLYRLQRTCYGRAHFNMTFMALWAMGMASFAFGACILALTVYVGLRWLAPDFVADCINQALDTLRAMNTADADALIDNVNRTIEQTGMPGPADVAAQMISMNIIGGALISVFTSAILYTRYSNPARRRKWFDSHNEEIS